MHGANPLIQAIGTEVATLRSRHRKLLDKGYALRRIRLETGLDNHNGTLRPHRRMAGRQDPEIMRIRITMQLTSKQER